MKEYENSILYRMGWCKGLLYFRKMFYDATLLFIQFESISFCDISKISRQKQCWINSTSINHIIDLTFLGKTCTGCCNTNPPKVDPYFETRWQSWIISYAQFLTTPKVHLIWCKVFDWNNSNIIRITKSNPILVKK